jgi:hypothetical protein
MADKYLKHNEGNIEEQEASTTSTGVTDAGKIPALDSTGRLDTSMMPVGVGADAKNITASENLAAGDFVNIYNNSGVSVRKADASDAVKTADGFVLSNVTSGNQVLVYFEGVNNQLSGLTIGENYYLSHSTPGSIVTAVGLTSTTGHIIQRLGRAVDTTEIAFEHTNPIKLA